MTTLEDQLLALADAKAVVNTHPGLSPEERKVLCAKLQDVIVTVSGSVTGWTNQDVLEFCDYLIERSWMDEFRDQTTYTIAQKMENYKLNLSIGNKL